MLIGLRLLLLIAGLAVGIAFLAYLFTKNPKFLKLTKQIIVGVLGFAALLVLVVLLERVMLR